MRDILTYQFSNEDMIELLDTPPNVVAEALSRLLDTGQIRSTDIYRPGGPDGEPRFTLPGALALAVWLRRGDFAAKIARAWINEQEKRAREMMFEEGVRAQRAALSRLKTAGSSLKKLLADPDFITDVHNCQSLPRSNGIRMDVTDGTYVIIGTGIPYVIAIAQRNGLSTHDLSRALRSMEGAYKDGVRRFGGLASRAVAVPLASFPPRPPTPEEDPAYYMDAEEF